MVWRLLDYLRPYWRRMIALLLTSLLVSLLNVAEPALMGKLTAAIFGGGRGLAIPSFIRRSGTRENAAEFLFRREGGDLNAGQAVRIQAVCRRRLGMFGRLEWSRKQGELALRLIIPPGSKFQPGTIAEELGRAVQAAVPGAALYPRVKIPPPSGMVLFPRIATVFLLPLVLLVVMFLRIGVFYGQTYLGAYVTTSAIRDIRNRLYGHLQRLSLGFFERQQTGQLMSRITSDVGTLQTFLQSVSIELIGDLFTVIVGVAYASLIDWRLALVTLAVMSLIAWPVSTVGRALRRTGRTIQARWADLTGVLQESLSGMRVVKAFQLESLTGERFNQHSESVFRAGLRGARLVGILTPSVEFLATLALAAFIWFGARRVQLGLLAPDQLFTFIFVVGFISNPVKRLSRMYGQVQHALAAGERVFQLLDEQPQIEDASGAIDLPALRGEVLFEHVSFAYGDGPLVLQEIDLAVRPGEIIALVGPSGAGKTSLVNLLPRFYDPTAGRVLVDGYDLRMVSVGSLRSQLGIVPQETLLFHATVAENIAYGRPGASQHDIIRAAKLANAHDFITGLPDGYDTLVGERGQTLSGGQRQRVAIARALLRDPRLLILDEATSSLDSESEAQVQEALERLMQGRTTFVIAHRLSTVRRANRLVVIQGGRVVEAGTHQELLAIGGVYARLYQRQLRGTER